MRGLWTYPCRSVLSLPGAPLPMTGLHNTDAPVWILSLDVQMARCDCEQGTALQVVTLPFRDASVSIQRKGHNGSLLGDVSISHTSLKNF